MGLFTPNVARMKAHGDVEGLARALSYKDWAVTMSAFRALADLHDARAVQPLIIQLSCPDYLVRCKAAELLGLLGDSRAVEPLISMLISDNRGERLQAIGALGMLRDARAVEPLIAALGATDHIDPEYRAAIAKVLGKLGDSRAVEALLRAVTDSEKSTSTLWDQRPLVDAATSALGEIGGPAPGSPVGVEALTVLIANPADGIRSWAAAALVDAGAVPATMPLLAALADLDAAGRVDVARLLTRFGDASVDVLSVLAVDPVAEVRNAATKALGLVGKPPALSVIERSLDSGDDEVRLGGALALARLGDARAVEPLVELLSCRPERVQLAALEALVALRDPRAVGPVAVLLKVKSMRVQLAAVKALGTLADSRAVQPLVALLTSPDELAGKASWLDEVKKKVEVQVSAIEALAGLGDGNAVEPLVGLMTAYHDEVRAGAAKALIALADARAVEPLVGLLSAENWWVRVEALDTLVGLLSAAGADVRAAGQETLSALGETRVVKPLIPMLADARSSAAVLRGLQALEAWGIPMADEDRAAYYLVSNQLDKCLEIGVSAIAPLIALLKTPAAANKAAEVLEEMGAPAVEPLCTALVEDAKAAAGFAPTRLPPGASIAGENWYWEGATFRKAIARILAKIGDTRAVEPLTWVSQNDPHVVDMLENEEIAARDDRWPVRDEAREALALIAPNS